MEIAGNSEKLRGDIRAAGLRATASRIAVLGLLRTTEAPLSHAEVVHSLETGPWDRATLYRNLIDLERVGLARRTQLGEPVWRFEDAGAEHGSWTHPHFVCTACGDVVCLPDLQMAVREAPGCGTALRRRSFEVQLRGVCDACGGEE